MANSDAAGAFTSAFLTWLLQASLWAAGIAILVLLAQRILGRWLAPRWRYGLWFLVVLRLALPILPSSPTSALNIWHLLPSLVQRLTHSDGARDVSLTTAPPTAPSRWQTVVRFVGTDDASVSAQPVTNMGPSSSRATVTPHLVFLVWFAVAMALMFRLIAANVRMSRRLRRARIVTDPEILELLADCCNAMQVASPPQLLVTDAVRCPAAAGVLKPRILLPPGLVGSLATTELRMVLLHELAHVRSRDVALNWLLAVLQIMHWFNPVIWLAMSRMRCDREAMRDETILRLRSMETDGVAESYVQTLLKLAESLSSGRPILPAPATVAGMLEETGLVSAVLGAGRSLQRRLAMIDRFSTRRRRLALLGPALLLSLGATVLTRPQEPSASQPNAPTTRSAPAGDPDITANQQLNRELPPLEFESTAFSDVIDQLHKLSGANIVVKWKRLEEAGIEKNRPVSARLRNIKLSKVLNVILDSVDGSQVKLGYFVSDGVITVTTANDLPTSVRVYSIRDLIIQIPQSIQPTTAASRPATGPSPQDLTNAIVRLIMDSVYTDTWRERGGSIGAIREMDGQLIVTQTTEAHRQIVSLLSQLRDERSLQITVETRMISCDRQAVDPLLDRWQRDATTRPTVTTPGKASAATEVFLTPQQVQEFLHASLKTPTSSIVTAPRLTLFNGQRAVISITSPHLYVRDYAVTRAAGGETRFDPVPATVQSGLDYEVQATISADRKWVTVLIHPKVTALLAMARLPWPARPAVSNLTIEEPKVNVSELSTMVSIADGSTLLMAGLKGLDSSTLNGAIAGSSTHPSDSGQGLYILVRPTIIPLHRAN